VRFGAAFGGAALLGEGLTFLPWDKLLHGFVYERWPPNLDDREGGRVFRLSSVAREVLASCGNVASAGTAGYLAARTVFVSQSGVVDALMARPYDSRSIITQAGGRVGLRSAVYFGALKVSAYAASEAAFSGDPLRFLLLAPGIFALMFGFPVFLPFLGVAWGSGRILGFSLGSRAVAYMSASGASPTSLVHGALFTHPIDRYFTARPLLATSGAILVSIAAMLPEFEEDISNGGDDGNGGFTWRYEKRWSPSAPTIDDYDEQQPPEEEEKKKEEEEEKHRRGEKGTAQKETLKEIQRSADKKSSFPKKEQKGKDGGGGEWV
jgi:hypothetical protein